MRVNVHPDADSFLERAEAWLLADEASRHLILSIAYLLRGVSHFRPPFYLATIESIRGVVGCAMSAAPDGLYLTNLPVESLSTIADQLSQIYVTLPEVIGPEVVATAFADRWSRQDWTLHSRNRCYALTSVIPPSRPAVGFLREGSESDLYLLDNWAADYRKESRSKVDMTQFFHTMVDRSLLFLWDDDGARCVVTTSSLTPNGAQVSAVYTPKQA